MTIHYDGCENDHDHADLIADRAAAALEREAVRVQIEDERADLAWLQFQEERAMNDGFAQGEDPNEDPNEGRDDE